MKNIFVPVIAIALMAAILFGMSCGLSDMRASNIAQARIDLMHTVLPGSTEFAEEPYTGEDANVRSVYKANNGYVVEVASQGYVDEIVMLVGLSNEGVVHGLVVVENADTIGLGRKALTDREFLSQFLMTSGDAAVGENIDALTGATVTSKTVARCVNSAVAVVTGADAATAATEWGG